MPGAGSLLFILVVAHAVCVAADDGDEFANNLFSDLAPLLALFGERVTMQFMSQSMGWADNIILAMAPLGIITAIVSAIRVGGPTWLKALIGRARENLAVAEADLMSSTSHDVCELWNGREVVRCMGSAPVAEFIVLLPKTGPYKNAKIVPMSEEQARERAYLKEIDLNIRDDLGRWRRPTTRAQGHEERGENFQPEIVIVGNRVDKGDKGNNKDVHVPNVSLNSHKYFWRGELRVAAAFGVILQLGILVYSGLATYYPTWRFKKNDNFISRYAYPCTAVGTLLLVGGMLVCGHVVESSTEEDRYQAKEGTAARLVWLQPSKTVNDQVFDSFAVFAEDDRTIITTSRRAGTARVKKDDSTLSGDDNSIRAKSEGKKNNISVSMSSDTSKQGKGPYEQGHTIGLAYKTVVGVMICLSGFVIQFIGLRGMHWSASVAQLGAVFAMTILRSLVRRGLARPPQSERLSSGFELEWFATTLGDLDNAPWINTSHAQGKASPEKERPVRVWRIICPEMHEELDQTRASGSSEANDKDNSAAHRVMVARRDLGRLAHWRGPASEDAIALAKAIEFTMDALLPSSEDKFIWSLGVSWAEPGAVPDAQSNAQRIHFELVKEDGKWKASLGDIESALSLWLYAVNKHEQEEHPLELGKQATRGRQRSVEDPDAWRLAASSWARRSLRLLGPNSQALRQDLEWWIPHRTAKLMEVKEDPQGVLEVENHRVVGFGSHLGHSSGNLVGHTRFHWVDMHTGKEEATNPLLAAEANDRLPLIYAQHMFSAFMWSLAKRMSRPIKGGADVVRPSEDIGGDTAWQFFTLRNEHVSKLAQDIQSTGLGMLDQIYLSIIPPLSVQQKLPQADGIVKWARQNANEHEQWQRWKEAGDVYLWLFQTAKISLERSSIAAKATALLMEYLRIITAALELQEAPYAEVPVPGLERLKLSVEKELRTADRGTLSNLLRLYEEQERSWKCVPAQEACCGWVEDNNYPDTFQLTILRTSAAARRFSPDIRRALEDGESVNQKDIHDWISLHYAAARGDERVVENLLDHRADVNARDLVEWTPLHYACQRGKTPAVQTLVRKGAELDACGRDGITPLHCAAMNGHSETVRAMIEAGAVLDVLDASRKTPLLWAIYKRQSDVVKYLFQNSNTKLRDHSGRTTLHLAAIAGLEITELLSDVNVDKDAKDKSGRTPLLLAAYAGREAVARLLLDRGAAIEAADRFGQTPLSLTVEAGHEAVARLLLDRGAAIEAADEDGQTPLSLAAYAGHEAVARLLLDRGAAIEAADRFGRTPLSRAAYAGREAVARLLLDRGAAIEAADEDGQTPLSLAVEAGHEAVARLLQLHANNTLPATSTVHHLQNSSIELVVD